MGCSTLGFPVYHQLLELTQTHIHQVGDVIVYFLNSLLTLAPKIITLVAYMLSHDRLFGTPCTVAHQAPLSMEFSRQEYWSELPFPSPGDLPNPGIKPISCSGRWILDHYATWETQQLFLAEGNFQRGPVKAAVIVVIPSAMESNHGGTIEYY